MARLTPPDPDRVADWTDVYFKRTRAVVAKQGDIDVTYAVFLRRPALQAARLAIDWMQGALAARGATAEIRAAFAEGAEVPAGTPLLWIRGRMTELVELETLLLMKLGPPSVAAHNARAMCLALPKAQFLAMDARHCAGTEMAELMAYGASVGSAAARTAGAVGFIGNATDATAAYFGNEHGFGTMPHALIGYAGSTVRAAELYHATFPSQPMTVLVDYFGAEITDSVAVARRFPELAAAGLLSLRLDTPGNRFAETLDADTSLEMIRQHAPAALGEVMSETEKLHLAGPGVSAASIHRLRDALDAAGFPKVRIVASSGFSAAKCRIMGLAGAPIDMVGTGSYLPEMWSDTYATADIVEYGGVKRVKRGREHLLPP